MRYLVSLLLLFGLQACLNKDLRQLELRSELTGHFTITPAELMENDSLATATLLTNTFQQKLDLAGIASNQLDASVANIALLGLNIPADSTFAFFDSLVISIENETDSVAVAELGEFTDASSNTVSLRLLNNDAKNLLISNDFWVEMNYAITAEELPAGIDIDFYIEWLMTSEF